MSTTPKKLYKRDNTGSTRVWWAEYSPDRRSYRLHSSKLGGRTVTSEWTRCERTNEGRANERVPEVQCQAEVEALYTKKKKRGYTETLSRIDEAKENLVGVMLAHDYNDHNHKLEFPVFSQPKLDGIRCIARPDGLWTRKGEPITTVPHIAEKIIPLCKKHGVIFDGELYNHVLRDDFNDIASLVRRQKSDATHAAKVRDVIQYHIYDLIDQKQCFNDRWMRVYDMFERTTRELHIVATRKIKTQKELDQYFEQYVEDGYEGQMVRVNGLYQFKRTKLLLKRKEFQDEEFEIIGMVEGKGNRSGMVGAVVFETAEGKQFQAALMGTNEYRRRIWREHKVRPFTGVDATVKYFHKTPDGIPRFPVVKSIDENK